MRLCLLILTLSVLAGFSGCQRTGTGADSNTPEATSTETPRPAASPKSDFERSLQFIRNGQFTYIYVFWRKDSKAFDSEDSQFLRTNAPQVVDWVTTEDKTKVIGGSNFNLEEGNLNVIKKRFAVEDYSGK